MTKVNKFDITVTYILVPMCLMAMTMVFFFSFQATQVLKERDALQTKVVNMASQFDNSQKLNAQFGGLVLGTQKLAKEGASSAKELVERLIQIGILPDPTKVPGAAPVPVAAPSIKAPVKP